MKKGAGMTDPLEAPEDALREQKSRSYGERRKPWTVYACTPGRSQQAWR